jgi:hypothetical protein
LDALSHRDYFIRDLLPFDLVQKIIKKKLAGFFFSFFIAKAAHLARWLNALAQLTTI